MSCKMSQVTVLVYSNGKKFEGSQGLTFEGQKRAIQIKRGISYDMLKKMIGAKLKLESHQIISSLTYRFPTSQSTYTDLEISDSEDVECMIIAAENHSQVNIALELYVEIGVVGASSSIPTQLVLPTKTLNSPSSNYTNNIGLSNNDEDRSSKDEDGSGVPNDESTDNTEVVGDFNANYSNVDGLASPIVAASPLASSLHLMESPQQAGEDSCSSPPSSSIPQPQPRSRTYHVFLNFRGTDTRRGFTDHLYASLERKGIITYRDDKDLEGGETISTELLKAIEESMIAITIFSPDYASSTWCLEELRNIVECKHNLGQFVVPIFYHVEPSEVRYQIGGFKEAFVRHEKRFGTNKVFKWREALRKVADLSGFDTTDKPEANFVDSTAEHIHKQVMKRLPSCTKNLASRVEKLSGLIDIVLKDVRFAYMGHIGHRVLPAKTFNSPSSNYANNIGLSNDDEDRSSKVVDGGGVPNDESSDDTEVAGDFNANSNVELASSIVAASPFASPLRENPRQAGEDSCSSPPSSSIPQPQPRSWTYHVFLNFKGHDTRREFTDHLYASLQRKGIITFMGNRVLRSGEMISTEVLKAIEESMIAITIFSPAYASSTWCLEELRKIVECKHNLGQFVVPVFYHVFPSEVQNQRRRFQEAFRRHEEKFGKNSENSEKVIRWRKALSEVAGCAGFTFSDRDGANFVARIADEIHKQVMKRLPSCTQNLASRVDELIRLIDIELKDVRFAYMGHNGWHK